VNILLGGVMYKPYTVHPAFTHRFFLSLYETIVICCLIFLLPIVEMSVWNVESLRQYNSFMVPVIEESFKTLAIILGGTIALGFTILFGTLEAVNYIFHALSKGPVHYSFIIFRILCIFLHLGLLGIQWQGFKLYKEGKGSLNWLIGFLTAYTIHYFWNVGLGLVVLKIVQNVCNYYETVLKLLFTLLGS